MGIKIGLYHPVLTFTSIGANASVRHKINFIMAIAKRKEFCHLMVCGYSISLEVPSQWLL